MGETDDTYIYMYIHVIIKRSVHAYTYTSIGEKLYEKSKRQRRHVLKKMLPSCLSFISFFI